MVHFISFLSTMTARALDLEDLQSERKGKKRSKTSLIAPCNFFFFIQKKKTLSKLNYDWDEIVELLPQEGKAD